MNAPASVPPPPPRPLRERVALVISNLEYGGAQRQVVALANRLNLDGGDARVVSLSRYVPLSTELHDAGTRLHLIEKRHRFDVTVVWRLAKLLRRHDIDVTHAFLLDAEIAARLAGALNPRTTVIGSERNADYVPRRRHLMARRLTGPWCAAVIANSNAGKNFQSRVFGVPPHSVFVVHNGVDLERFVVRTPEPARAEIGLARNVPVVGMFAAFKTQKNHAMYFRAAKRILERHADAVFLCVGAALHGGLQGSDAYQERMHGMIRELGLQDSVQLVGNRDDLARWYAACDLTVLTSRREGTPNVLLESMACGVPVVATDVADNAYVVPNGRVGFVVACDDDAALAERVSSLLAHPEMRRAMGLSARAWVEREFSLARLAERTSDVYRTVLERRSGTRV
jgi:glycosyltransferase involved in cell wall biosynthesis